MSQNSKNIYFGAYQPPYWLLLSLCLFLLTFSSRLSGQTLLQASTELSELLQSGAFTPSLRLSTHQFVLKLDGRAVQVNAPNRITLEHQGIYTITFTQPPSQEVHFAVLKLGNTLDTIRTSHTIQIFNQSGYLNWEAVGATDTLSNEQAEALTCEPCSTSQEEIMGTRIKTLRPLDQTVKIGDFLVAPYERLIFLSSNDTTIVQVRGRRKQVTKPTQRLLEMWYQYIAYQDPNWQDISLSQLRNDLANNPFLPKEIIELIPDSPIRASTYLPAQKQPSLSNWQQRLYINKTPIDVSLQPKLQYEKLNNPALPASQVASQQAQRIYAADERLGFSLNQDQLLKGLASFIEERAQEELNVAFLGRMQRHLEKDSLLLTLFPHTAQLFEQFALDNYRFIMDNAKTVFTSDLSNLGLNIYQVFELEALKDDLEYSSELYFAALVLQMINMVYLDVPTDTILINSYLALETQADILALQLRKKMAITLAQDTSLHQDIIGNYQHYTQTLQTSAAALNKQINELSSIINELREQVPYTHPLYPQVWEASDNLNHLKGQLLSWQQGFREQNTQLENQLRGIPSATFILANSQLKNYNRFFPSESDAPIEQISKGLEGLNQQLKSNEIQQITDWNNSASYLRQTILNLQRKWQLIQGAQLPCRIQRVLLAYQTLEKALSTEIAWWAETPSTQRPLLALQFLQNSLQQDALIGLKYQNLRQSLLQNKTNFASLKNDLPLLEETLENRYWPLSLQNMHKLRFGKDTIAAPGVQQNVNTFREALPQFSALFEKKQQTNDIDQLEQYLDSLQNFFDGLPQVDIAKNQTRAFHNAYLPILDSLIHFSQFEQVALQAAFTNIEEGLDTLGQAVARAAFIRNDLSQQILDFQAKLPDSVLLRSSQRIRSLSQVFAVGNHIVQALKSDQIQTPPHSLLSQMTITDSLAIHPVSRIDTIRQKWLSFDQLEATFKKDSLSRALFFGLLFEDIRHIPNLQMGRKGSPLQADKVANLSISILRTIEQLRSIEDKRQSLAQDQKLSLTDYSSLIFQTLSVMEQTFELFKAHSPASKPARLLQNGQQILGQSNQLYQNLMNQQYNMALANLAAMTQSIVTEQQSHKLQRDARQFQSKLLTYGSFMAAVALAQNPEQVKTALEIASVEVGYSRVKRVNSWNIAFNAYLGLGAGYEQTTSNNSGFQLNLATPIGLSVSKSIGHGHSLSAFGSILDLGPIVTYDFDTKSALTDVELGFEDFVAPGAFLFWNIANSPFTTGLGIQRTSKIRVIGSDSNPQRTTRVLGTFLIDIPIFNLYTKKN